MSLGSILESEKNQCCVTLRESKQEYAKQKDGNMKATCSRKHWESTIPKNKSSCVCVRLQTERKASTEGCWGKRIASLSYVMWSMSQKPECKTKQCHWNNDSGDKRNDTVNAGVGASFGVPMRKGTKYCHPLFWYVLRNESATTDLSFVLRDHKLVHVDYHLLSKTLLTGKV